MNLILVRRCTPFDGKNELHYYHDPLKCPLPKAPSLKMYCLYGVGKPCERSYHYMHLPGPKVCFLTVFPFLPTVRKGGTIAQVSNPKEIIVS